MPELFAFLLKVNIALILFCAGYYLVLRKLTFYTLNRVYLVGAILLSSVYPFVDLSTFAQRNREIVEPVQNVVIVWKAPAEKLIQQAAYWNWLEAAFWTVAVILAMRLMSQLFSLYNIYRRSDEREINGQKVRVVNGDISPFSFWQSIFVNPDKLSPADLHNILEHEQVHVREWHTLDILLSEISVIFYWFNPGVWMMKRAIRENIEFITDRKILQQGVDSRAYQYSLLNVSFNQHAPAALTSNFNFSTLKKRIKMMNAQRSSKLNLTRYALVLPVVTVCLFAFSLSKAEVVKNSPVINTIKTATVKTLDKLDEVISLPADTTPKPKKVTKTISVVTIGEDKPERTVNIVTNGNVDVVTIKTDSFKISRDVNTLYYNLSRGNSVDIDSVKTVMINGKKANKEELMKVAPELAKKISVNGQYLAENIVVNGQPIKSNNLVVIDDKYRIKADSAKAVVVVDGVVFKPRTDLKEIVVNGYGTRSLTPSLGENVNTGAPTNFKGKLIVINGKVATEKELKKLSVIDIEETMSLSAKNAVKYYGENGKNGAVLITTKKK